MPYICNARTLFENATPWILLREVNIGTRACIRACGGIVCASKQKKLSPQCGEPVFLTVPTLLTIVPVKRNKNERDKRHYLFRTSKSYNSRRRRCIFARWSKRSTQKIFTSYWRNFNNVSHKT